MRLLMDEVHSINPTPRQSSLSSATQVLQVDQQYEVPRGS